MSLAACTSWLPSLEFGGYRADLRLESEPPGAEARTSGGQVCRTPCVLSVDAKADFSVAFNLEGYVQQAVQVQVRVPGDPRFDPGAPLNVQFDPNPVAVVLEAIPAPPPKRRPARRRAAPKRPAAAPAVSRAVQAPAPAPAPASPPVVATQPEPPATPRALPSTIPPTFGGPTAPLDQAPR
jgi:hypothetical protein